MTIAIGLVLRFIWACLREIATALAHKALFWHIREADSAGGCQVYERANRRSGSSGCRRQRRGGRESDFAAIAVFSDKSCTLTLSPSPAPPT
jgi:hypothetical protein